ncbi:MAG TPA: ATP-binding protein [Spirochaetia bacterium]
MEKIASRGELVLDEAAFRGDKTLKVSVYPFRDEDYLFLGTIVLIEDVSTDRYVNDYLLRAEKIASTAELAAGVAHEINDPLGIVKNYVELLKLKGLDGDTGTKLQKIENEITRIEKTVGSLLSFAKFDEVSFHAVDVVELVEEVVVLMEHRFAEKGVRVTQRLAEPGLLVPGDEHRLKQLFVNLLANGIEAVEPETGEIAVAVTSEAEGRSVEVSVTDNGCGIADEIRGRIFNPFFSTKKNKRNVGLGLSICQRIVELHNGMITCASETGRGTRFSVRFPRAEAAALDG